MNAALLLLHFRIFNQFMNRTEPKPTRCMPECDPITQLARQHRLDELYELDGRHFPDHPSHGLYTGLWIQYGGAGA